jgi:hypothetical protein
MIEPAKSRARPSGLYAALCFLVPFGGVLPVLLAGAPSADEDGGSRLALNYWWYDAPRR